MNRVQKQIIKDALEYPENLSIWELAYMRGLADKPDNYELSEKQNKIVNSIGSKVA